MYVNVMTKNKMCRHVEISSEEGASTSLTKKEMLVLKCVEEGASNKIICSQMGVTDSTVRTHLRSIFRKLGARSRSHAVALATKKKEL